MSTEPSRGRSAVVCVGWAGDPSYFDICQNGAGRDSDCAHGLRIPPVLEGLASTASAPP